MERWDIAFAPDRFEAAADDERLSRSCGRIVTPEEIEASLTPDRRGLLHAELHGMPVRDEKTGAAAAGG